MLERGATLSPQTELCDERAIAPDSFGVPSQGAPAGVSEGPDFCREKYACELKSSSFSWPGEWFSGSPGDNPLGSAALFSQDGTLTDLGRLYASL